MKATYNSHIIESLRGKDGLYYATIDGNPSGISARYKRVAIKRAVQALQEQEQPNKYQELKEMGL
jgi:hypothetical protein